MAAIVLLHPFDGFPAKFTAEHLVAASTLCPMSAEQEELVRIAAVCERCTPPCFREEAMLSYGSPLEVFEIKYHHVIQADLLMTLAICLWGVYTLAR